MAAELNVAAAKGELSAVRALLEAGGDVDARAAALSGWTPLMCAASEGHAPVARCLVDHGAALDARADEGGDSALALAAYYGHAEVVALLVDHGADTDATDHAGRSPLMAAAEMGHLEAAQVLLRREREVERPKDEQQAKALAALLLGARNGHLDVVDALTVHAIQCLRNEDAALMPDKLAPAMICAAERGHKHIVEFLVQAVVTVVDEGRMLQQATALVNATDSRGYTALRVAAANAQIDTLQLLLELGADTEAASADGWTPLIAAAKNGHSTIVDLLIVNGAKVDATNKGGGSALYVASFEGQVKCVQSLVESGCARTDLTAADGWTPLMAAAKTNSAAVVKYLLSVDSKLLEARKEGGATAVYVAALHGSLDALAALVDAGADVDVADDEGWTPLMCAAENGHVSCMHLLVANAADLDARSNEQDTALILAAYYGHELVVRALVAFGADTQAKDNDGRTPLIAASEGGHVLVVRELLSKFQDGTAVCEELVEALHRAVSSGRVDVVRTLMDFAGEDQAARRLLIEAPRSLDGRSALTIAAAHGHFDVLCFLLSADDKCTEATSQRTRRSQALRAAALHGHLSVVQKLLESGEADVDAANKDGWTAIMLAARGEHVDVVKYLYSRGAHVELETSDDETRHRLNGREKAEMSAALMLSESGAPPMPLAF